MVAAHDASVTNSQAEPALLMITLKALAAATLAQLQKELTSVTPAPLVTYKVVCLVAVAPNCLKWHLLMVPTVDQATVTLAMLGVTVEQKALLS